MRESASRGKTWEIVVVDAQYPLYCHLDHNNNPPDNPEGNNYNPPSGLGFSLLPRRYMILVLGY